MKKLILSLIFLFSYQIAFSQYKLDVLHGGSDGARIKSSASFSVVDIDANSGDAALRFVKAGANQWNVRNRPADDYFEIFELGGGGSRVVIQDATGNVGIGETTAPSYKLDVLHGGSTGARIRSAASFSVVDIDAQSGDAALRFVKAGVNQWNMRNNPSTDDLEFFELSGGGSRMIIQNTTGNLGVSQSLPKARVDISGANSTQNTFLNNVGTSLTTVLAARDLNSGDAGSLKVGVYGSANGSTGQNFGVWGETNSTVSGSFFNIGVFGIDHASVATSYAGYFVGKVFVSGTLTTSGPKPFTIDHPLDPENKVLHHFAIESPEVLNMYSGNATTDATGKITVNLPEYFSEINKDFRYQLTVIGSFAQAIIGEEIVGNKFVIETSKPNVKVSWEVKGVRNDGYMKYVNDMSTEEMKPEGQRGKYITPKAFGKAASLGVNYMGEQDIDKSKARVENKARVSDAIEGTSLEQKAIVSPKASNTVIEGTSLEQKKQ